MLISQCTRERFAERIRVFFGGKPSKKQVAALPWRSTENGVEIMLITSRGTGRWVLPKGWPENGEAPHEAAAREAQEEAGLAGSVSDCEVGRYYYRKWTKSGREKPCEVAVFPLQVAEARNEWAEKGQRMRRWVSPAKAATMVKEPGLAELIGTYFRDKSGLPA